MRITRIDIESSNGKATIELGVDDDGAPTIEVNGTAGQRKAGRFYANARYADHALVTDPDAVLELARRMQARLDGVVGCGGDIRDYHALLQRFER